MTLLGQRARSRTAGRRLDASTAVPVVLICIMSLALAGYAVKTGTPLIYDDEREYVEIAQNVRAGKGFQLDGTPTAYRTPAWPLVLAAFLGLGLPVSLLSLVSAGAMIGTAVVAAILGARISGSNWGALAGVAVLAYPLNVYTATTLYPQAMASLLVVSLWLLAYLITERRTMGERGSPVTYVGLGLVAALLALAVPTLAFTGVVVVLWVVLTARGDRRRAAGFALLALATPLAAWMTRNAVTIGAPAPLSTSTGLNLLIGNNPTATATSGTVVDISGPLRTASTMPEAQVDDYLRNTALEWIVGNPADSFGLYVAKVANYFSPYNEPVTAVSGVATQRYIAYLSCAVLVALVIARVLLRRRRPLGSTEYLFLGIFFANAFVMAVFFTRTRFRQPLETILLIEAAVALAVIIAAAATRRGRSAAALDSTEPSPSSTGAADAAQPAPRADSDG